MKVLRIVLLLLIIVGVFSIVSCGPPPVTIETRVGDFLDDLNNDFSNCYTHVHPDNSSYNTVKPDSFWGIKFDAASTYTYSSVSVSGSTATVTITNDSGGTLTGVVLTFSMKEDDPNVWFINGLSGTGSVGTVF